MEIHIGTHKISCMRREKSRPMTSEACIHFSFFKRFLLAHQSVLHHCVENLHNNTNHVNQSCSMFMSHPGSRSWTIYILEGRQLNHYHLCPKSIFYLLTRISGPAFLKRFTCSVIFAIVWWVCGFLTNLRRIWWPSWLASMWQYRPGFLVQTWWIAQTAHNWTDSSWTRSWAIVHSHSWFEGK